MVGPLVGECYLRWKLAAAPSFTAPRLPYTPCTSFISLLHLHKEKKVEETTPALGFVCKTGAVEHNGFARGSDRPQVYIGSMQ